MPMSIIQNGPAKLDDQFGEAAASTRTSSAATADSRPTSTQKMDPGVSDAMHQKGQQPLDQADEAVQQELMDSLGRLRLMNSLEVMLFMRALVAHCREMHYRGVPHSGIIGRISAEAGDNNTAQSVNPASQTTRLSECVASLQTLIGSKSVNAATKPSPCFFSEPKSTLGKKKADEGLHNKGFENQPGEDHPSSRIGLYKMSL